MDKFLKKIILTSVLILVFLPVLKVDAQAENYTLLAPLPLKGDSLATETNLSEYLTGGFNLAIAISIGLAFVMITFGGITYATSDAVGKKEDGKKYIENALWGLAVVIGAYTLLYTINPQMLDFKLLSTLPSAETPPATVTPGGSFQPKFTAGVDSGSCSTCVALSGLPTTGSAVGKGVTPELLSKLNALNVSLQNQNTTWRITEGWPPSQNHQNSCHKDGTCIDANTLPDPATVNKFINSAVNAGLRPVYEVETQAEANALISGGVNSSRILVLPPINGRRQITAPHFSVYNK